MKITIHNRLSPLKTLYAILWVAFLSITEYASAASETIGNPIHAPDFQAVLEGIAKWVTVIGIPAVIFFIILTGIYFVAAQGNEEKLKQARTMLVWTLVGALIVAGAAVIAGAVNEFAKSLGGS